MANRATLRFQDSEGVSGTGGFWTNEASFTLALNNLVTAYQDVSLASHPSTSLGLEDVAITSVSGAGPYSNIEDKATIYFRDADGETVSYSIPAPDASVFLADGETVDDTAALMAALITEILLTAVSRSGAAIVEFLRGIRRRVKDRG